MAYPLTCLIDGNSIIPGNWVRLQRMGALNLSEMPILPSRQQVYTPRHRVIASSAAHGPSYISMLTSESSLSIYDVVLPT